MEVLKICPGCAEAIHADGVCRGCGGVLEARAGGGDGTTTSFESPADIRRRKMNDPRQWKIAGSIAAGFLVVVLLVGSSGTEASPDATPSTEATTHSTPRTGANRADFGPDIDEDADPGPSAPLAQRCAAVRPGATRQEISDCVVLYSVMKK